MILIPYSKVNYRTEHSIEETKQILLDKFKSEIVGNNFEIIEDRIGQHGWTMNISGQIFQEQDHTKIMSKVTFNYSAWILFFLIAILTLGLAAGIFIYSRISGELDPRFWNLLEFNLFVYFLYLVVYQIKKYRIDKHFIRILSAVKITIANRIARPASNH